MKLRPLKYMTQLLFDYTFKKQIWHFGNYIDEIGKKTHITSLMDEIGSLYTIVSCDGNADLK